MYELWEALVSAKQYSDTFQAFKEQFASEENQELLYNEIGPESNLPLYNEGDLQKFKSQFFDNDYNSRFKIEDKVINPAILQSKDEEEVLRELREPLKELGVSVSGRIDPFSETFNVEDANGRKATVTLSDDPNNYSYSRALSNVRSGIPQEESNYLPIKNLNDWLNAGKEAAPEDISFIKKYNTPVAKVIQDVDVKPTKDDLDVFGGVIDMAIMNVANKENINGLSTLYGGKYTLAEQYNEIVAEDENALNTPIIEQSMQYLDDLNYFENNQMSRDDIREVIKQMATRGRYIDSQFQKRFLEQSQKRRNLDLPTSVTPDDKKAHEINFHQNLSTAGKKRQALNKQINALTDQINTLDEKSENYITAKANLENQIRLTEEAMQATTPEKLKGKDARYTNSAGELITNESIERTKLDILGRVSEDTKDKRTLRETLEDARDYSILDEKQWQEAGQEVVTVPRSVLTNSVAGRAYLKSNGYDKINTFEGFQNINDPKYLKEFNVPLYDLYKLNVDGNLLISEEAPNAWPKVKSYRGWKANIDEKNIALGELYYLNLSPENIDKDKGSILLSSAINNSGLLGNYSESRNKFLGQRDRLDIMQEFAQDYNALNPEQPPIIFNKESQKRFERTIGESIVEGTGGFVPLIIELGAYEYATAGAGSVIGFTQFLSKTQRLLSAGKKISNLRKLGYYGGVLAKEEIKTQLAGFDTGSGIAFAGGGLLLPKFKNLGFLTSSANKIIGGGVSGATLAPVAQFAEQLIASTNTFLGHDANFQRFLEETYIDASDKELAEKLFTDAATFALIGVTHLKKGDISYSAYRKNMAEQHRILYAARERIKELNNEKPSEKRDAEIETIQILADSVEKYLQATEFKSKFDPDTNPNFERDATNYIKKRLKGLTDNLDGELNIAFVDDWTEGALAYGMQKKDAAKWHDPTNTLVFTRGAFTSGKLSHEIFHAGARAYFKSNPQAARAFNEKIIDALKGKVSNDFYDEITNKYKDLSKQGVTEELMANIAEYYSDPLMDPAGYSERTLGFELSQLFNSWAERAGISFLTKKINNGQDLVDFMGRFAYNVGRGKDVSKQLEKFFKMDFIGMEGTPETKDMSSRESEAALGQFDFIKEQVTEEARKENFNPTDYAQKLFSWSQMVGFGDYQNILLNKLKQDRAKSNLTGIEDKEIFVAEFVEDTSSLGFGSILTAWQKGQDIIDFVKRNNPSRAEIEKFAEKIRYNTRTISDEELNLDRLIAIGKGERPNDEAVLNTYVEKVINKRLLGFAIEKGYLISRTSLDAENFKQLADTSTGPDISARRFHDTSDIEQPLRNSRKMVSEILDLPKEVNEKTSGVAEKSIVENFGIDIEARIVGGWETADGKQLSASLYKQNEGAIYFDGVQIKFGNARSQKELAANLDGINKLTEYLIGKKNKNEDLSIDVLKSEAKRYGIKFTANQAEKFYLGVMDGKIKGGYNIKEGSWKKQNDFKTAIRNDVQNQMLPELEKAAGGLKSNFLPTDKYRDFVDRSHVLFKNYFSQYIINKRFGQQEGEKWNIEVGGREATAQGNKLFKKKDVTLAEWRKFFIGDGSKRIDGRRRSLLEAISEEMAFDAVMEKMYDNAFKEVITSEQPEITNELVSTYAEIVARSMSRRPSEDFSSLELNLKKLIDKKLGKYKGSDLFARFIDRINSAGWATASSLSEFKEIADDYLAIIRDFLQEKINIRLGDFGQVDLKSTTSFARIKAKEIKDLNNVNGLEGDSLKAYDNIVTKIQKGLPKELTAKYGTFIKDLIAYTSRPTKEIENGEPVKLNVERYENVSKNVEFGSEFNQYSKELQEDLMNFARDRKIKFSKSSNLSSALKQINEIITTQKRLGDDRSAKEIVSSILNQPESTLGIEIKTEAKRNRELLELLLRMFDEMADMTEMGGRQKFAEDLAPIFIANDSGNLMRILSPFEFIQVKEDGLVNLANEHLGIKSYFAGTILAEIYNGTLIGKEGTKEQRLQNLRDHMAGWRSSLGERLDQNASNYIFGTHLLNPIVRMMTTGGNIYETWTEKVTNPKTGKLVDKRYFSLKENIPLETYFKNLDNHIDLLTGKTATELMYEDVAQNVREQIKGVEFNAEDVAEGIRQSVVNKGDMSSLDLTKEFDAMLSRRTKLEGFVSPARARQLGEGKGKWDLYIPPNAEDFAGLLYKLYGKGEQGDADMLLAREALLLPYERGENAISTYRQKISQKFKEFNKNLKAFDIQFDKEAVKRIEDAGFTVDQAIRVWIWEKLGYEIPNIGLKEKANLVNIIAKSPKLLASALQFKNMFGTGRPYPEPKGDWYASNIKLDAHRYINEGARKMFLEEFITNADAIFTPEFYSKAEAGLGLTWVKNMKEMLNAMKTGQSTPTNLPEYAVIGLNYINGAVGNIMFLNGRSAVLQTISMANFVNWTDNNILAVGKAVYDQKNYWKTFMELMNSDFLKQRRDGLEISVEEAEIAKSLRDTKNPLSHIWGKLIQLGYAPTKFADSFAIAAGGAPFYINRTKTYEAQGFSNAEAKKKAFDDFRMLAETHQQSSRQDKVSNVQRGLTGRFIYSFSGAPFQMAREQKKAGLDLIYNRGDKKTNISKFIYYGAMQNLLFTALQQGIFAAAFEEDEVLAGKDKRAMRLANSMLDATLRSSGLPGALLAMGKNTIIKYTEENEKGYQGDMGNVIAEAINISPPAGAKFRNIYKGLQSRKFLLHTKKGRAEVESTQSWIENPLLHANARIIGGITNYPVNRLVTKADNMNTAITGLHRGAEADAWQRYFLAAGWDKWSLGFYEKKPAENDTRTRSEIMKDAWDKKGMQQWKEDSIKNAQRLINPNIIKNTRFKKINLFN